MILVDRATPSHLKVASAITIALVSAVIGLLYWSIPASSGGVAILYVTPNGSDAGNFCKDPNLPCRSVQHAVNQATDNAEIRVAEGRYTAPTDLTLYRPVVEIAKTVILRGSYRNGDWTQSDVDRWPSILDGEDQRQVILIWKEVAPEVRGFRITGGRSQNSFSTFSSAGSGIFVMQANALIEGNIIEGNRAPNGAGAGVYVFYAPARIERNRILSNTTVGDRCPSSYSYYETGGGGVYLEGRLPITVFNNEFRANQGCTGAGIGLRIDSALIVSNTFRDNVSNGYGGALAAHFGQPLVFRNHFQGNRARDGGAISLYLSTASVDANLIEANSATDSGGGLWIAAGPPEVTRNVARGNTAQSGGAVRVFGGPTVLRSNAFLFNDALTGSGVLVDPQFLGPTVLDHNTFNGGRGDGVALYVVTGTVQASNTVFANLSVGIRGRVEQLAGVHWHGTPITMATPFTPTLISGERTGDPFFAPDGYHLIAGSAALGGAVGMSSGSDIDGQARPLDGAGDLGADEYSTGAPPIIPLPPEFVPCLVATSAVPGDLIANGGFDCLEGWQAREGVFRIGPGRDQKPALILIGGDTPDVVAQPIQVPTKATYLDIGLEALSPTGPLSVDIEASGYTSTAQIDWSPIAGSTWFAGRGRIVLIGMPIRQLQIRLRSTRDTAVDAVWAVAGCGALPTGPPNPSNNPTPGAGSTPNPTPRPGQVLLFLAALWHTLDGDPVPGAGAPPEPAELRRLTASGPCP